MTNQERIVQYVYGIKLYAMFSDNTNEDISAYLHHLSIEINPVMRVYPLFNIKFNIKPELIVKIQNDKDIKFSIRIIKSNMYSNMVYDRLIDTVLIPILEDVTPLNLSDTLVKRDTELAYNLEYFEMKLVPKDSIESNKILVSGVYTDTTVMNVVMLLGQKLNNKLYISKFDNTKKYKQVILIPNNVITNIRYLNDTYGFYKNGMNMFYGFDIFRIYNRDYYNISEGKNSINVHFPANDLSNNFQTGSYREGNNNNIYCTVNDLKIINSKKLTQEVLGNNHISFAIDNDSNTSEELTKTTNKEFNKTKLMINNYDNDMKESEVINIINEVTDMQLLLTNVDCEIEDLFKIYKFNFINKLYKNKFNGNYIMNNVLLDFKRIYNNGAYNFKELLMLKKL